MNSKMLTILALCSTLTAACSSTSIRPLAESEANNALLKDVMILGGSGMVGDGILKALIADPNVGTIHIITRRETPRMKEAKKSGKAVITRHMNYLDYTEIKQKIEKVSSVYWALGISATKVSDEKYTEIHVDYPINFVKLWLSLQNQDQKNKKKYSFHLITGAGTGKDSWFHWAREKAKAEAELTRLAKDTGLKVVTYRPSFIRPTEERASWYHSISSPLSGAVRSSYIGQSMIEITVRDEKIAHGSIIDHSTIKAYAEAYRARTGKKD